MNLALLEPVPFFAYLIYYEAPENQKEDISVFEELVKNATFN